mmetsp:Transcript_13715/g.28153  ORF Transcript_13715/g.28153 Transcript_13715/m.28153 type:complete len:391 (-) Transcript_13715:593-1765(-)
MYDSPRAGGPVMDSPRPVSGSGWLDSPRESILKGRDAFESSVLRNIQVMASRGTLEQSAQNTTSNSFSGARKGIPLPLRSGTCSYVVQPSWANAQFLASNATVCSASPSTSGDDSSGPTSPSCRLIHPLRMEKDSGCATQERKSCSPAQEKDSHSTLTPIPEGTESDLVRGSREVSTMASCTSKPPQTRTGTVPKPESSSEENFLPIRPLCNIREAPIQQMVPPSISEESSVLNENSQTSNGEVTYPGPDSVVSDGVKMNRSGSNESTSDKQISLPSSKTKPLKRIKTYTQDVPSKYCHLCSRKPEKPEGRHLICLNFWEKKCLKIVCKKCFDKNKWNWEVAQAEEVKKEWLCCHCRGVCPRRASCSSYEHTNSVRREKKLSERLFGTRS